MKIGFLLTVFLITMFSFGLSFSQTPEAAPQFDKVKIILGSKKITIDLAQTPTELSYGLMHRQNLPEDSGMLFIFPKQEIRNFWMKNTFVNLSIGFFDKNKKLVDIQEMTAVKSIIEEPNSYMSKYPAKYALEMPRNWFEKNKIKLGEKFEFVSEKKLKRDK